jgi:GNAT superfamily N-acetyltransferase
MKDALIHVTRLDQAEEMRVIRNACREWMTNDRLEISREQQVQWFLTIQRQHEEGDESVLPFLYQPRPDHLFPRPFGYGLLRKQDGKWWLSGGLLPEWRGKGYGKGLFGELADYVHALRETAWLTVWEHNERGLATYKSLGFTVQSIVVDAYAPPILVMCLPPDVSFRMHKLVCPLCGIATNKTRGPKQRTGIIREHGDCLGAGATVDWEACEIQ